MIGRSRPEVAVNQRMSPIYTELCVASEASERLSIAECAY